MKTKGFDDQLARIMVAGVPLEQYLQDNMPDTEVIQDHIETGASLKKIIYRKPRFKPAYQKNTGRVKEYTNMEKFDFILRHCDRSIVDQYDSSKPTTRQKLVKLRALYTLLNKSRFRVSEVKGSLKESGYGDAARYCYMLYQAGALTKEPDGDGTYYYIKQPMSDEELVSTLIANNDKIVGYGTRQPVSTVEPREVSRDVVVEKPPVDDFFSDIATQLREGFYTVQMVLPKIDEKTFMKLYLEYGER